ncbi:MAG TPA: hypothetical protein VL977_06125, partial [Solirubrobacteraceae bacterium]|nr:hypothetical protein [Solirubrobacteraceae bacterium]
SALVVRRALGSIAASGDELERATLAGMLAGVAGYGAALLFYFTSPASTPFAALLAGALLAGPAAATSVASPGSARVTARRVEQILAAGAFAALAVVLALGALAEIPLRAAYVAAGNGDAVAAERDFRAAHALRPWDPAIDADASHAFAELTSGGVAGALADGQPWARRALSATPESVVVIADAATLDVAAGRPRTAARLLDGALAIDPLDGDLRLAAAAAALVLREPARVIALAAQARADYPPDGPRARELIADARRIGH